MDERSRVCGAWHIARNPPGGILDNVRKSSILLELGTCDIDSFSQSFIYDRLGRYVSAKDTTKCLDIENLSEFQECNSNLGQQWRWREKSDLLQNQWLGNYLAHDVNDNQLVSASEQSEHIKLRTLTDYTNIYAVKP